MEQNAHLIERIEKLNAIGIALSAEKDTTSLLERILLEARAIVGADGGTLYLVKPDQTLKFEMIHTESLHLDKCSDDAASIHIDPLPLYDTAGQANDKLVVGYSFHHAKTVNIADVYVVEGFDFSGPRAFDREMGYRTKSVLTIPMKNHENDIIGVLQLINKLGDKDQLPADILPFSEQDQRLAESLASQAAVALTNKRLLDNLKELFESFMKMIATAIDEKSPFTGNHCRRVPELTMMLAEAAHATTEGPLQSFCLNDEDRYELEVAGWLHDCGKVTTPEHVIDKATKLETIYDRVGLTDTRFEVLKRDMEISKLKKTVDLQQSGEMTDAMQALLDAQYHAELSRIEDDRAFIRLANIGNEFMQDEDKARVRRIASRTWVDPDGDRMQFLTEDEMSNLCITKGTLNQGERDLINHHITMTIKMLEALPFPKHLANVPEYAGGHHERMDGKGYPKGLTREELSIPARTMAIADIFEALTAKDRPYKEPKKLSEALMILGHMKDDNHIDPDLYHAFIDKKVYLHYAKEFLMPFQIDIDEPEEIPGYLPQKKAS